MHPAMLFFFFHFFGFMLLMYFLPTVIAIARNKRDTIAIFLLNLFLGFTMIGWWVALIWAAKHDNPMYVR